MKTSLLPWLRGLAGAFLLILPARAADADWRALFDGSSLAGWKAAEHPASFTVEDGAIVCHGPRAHLFFVGAGGDAEFENFELSLEVMTHHGTNSGVFFHTAWQESGWPTEGFEVQINNSQEEHGGYRENKKTGSLYGIRNIYKAMAPDEVWFNLLVTVQRPRVQIRVNGVLVVEYVEPRDPLPASAPKLNRLGRGTFALQGHDPASTARFRNIRVRPLPAGEASGIARPRWDEAEGDRLALGKDNYPLMDLHTHLKGDLTLERAIALSRSTGMGLGIATNGGIGFPVQNDAAALGFVESMRGQPVFVALQAEGREWMQLFTPTTRAAFDYVFTDAMTWTNKAGKRLRLWIPAEADIGPNPEAFMEELVEQTVRIISDEPIDIYVNPTFLPESIAARYDELWTEARMRRVIDAAVRHEVAIEINARFRLPSERFIRLAKAAGAKFTIGTNNTSAADFGDWSYPFEMQRKAGLTWKDLWVPGHGPTRAQRALAR